MLKDILFVYIFKNSDKEREFFLLKKKGLNKKSKILFMILIRFVFYFLLKFTSKLRTISSDRFVYTTY